MKSCVLIALLLMLPIYHWTCLAHDPEDFLLEKEDSRLRSAENIKEKVDALTIALDRRLSVLEYRRLKTDHYQWEKKCKRDQLLYQIEPYTDDRLLQDYVKCLLSLLRKVEGAFSTSRPQSLKNALRNLKKKSENHLKILEQLEPVYSSDKQNAPLLKKAVLLTRKSVSGAEKGLKQIAY